MEKFKKGSGRSIVALMGVEGTVELKSHESALFREVGDEAIRPRYTTRDHQQKSF
jgi:hypothetical protein